MVKRRFSRPWESRNPDDVRSAHRTSLDEVVTAMNSSGLAPAVAGTGNQISPPVSEGYDPVYDQKGGTTMQMATGSGVAVPVPAPGTGPYRRGGWHPTRVQKVAIATGGLLAFLAVAGVAYSGRAQPVETNNTHQEQTGSYQPTLPGNITITEPVAPTQPVVPGLEDVMSEAEVKATVEGLLADNRLVTVDDIDTLTKIEQVNKSLYFMLTGKTFEQQRFVTKMLPRSEYIKEVPGVYGGVENSSGAIGLGRDGTITLYALLPSPKSFHLLLTVAHETGSAYGARGGPIGFDVGQDNPDAELGVRKWETLQALYRGAVLNKLRELGVNLQPATADSAGNTIDALVDSWMNPRGTKFFFDAWGAAWVLSLDDSEAGKNLRETGWAGSKPLMRVYGKHAMLDFKQHTREENIATHDLLEEQLIAALENKHDYAGAVKDVMAVRIARGGGPSSRGQYLLNANYMLP